MILGYKQFVVRIEPKTHSLPKSSHSRSIQIHWKNRAAVVCCSADEPLSPVDRVLLQPPVNQVIICTVGVKYPIDIDALKAGVRASPILRQPRFSSLVVLDDDGREYWRKTDVDIDRHIIVPTSDFDSSDVASSEDAVNEYISQLAVSSPLSTDKPLWEIHLLMAHNAVVLRVHHALGDGVSLMSLLTAPATSSAPPPARRREWRSILDAVWYTLVFVVEFLLRILWVEDEKTAVSGGAGVELWPRKLATAKFSLEDMKVVKKAIPGATINDVLFGIISSGLSRYLSMQSPPEALQEGLKMTGVSMVNLRSQLQDTSSKANNQFGIWLVPVYYEKNGSEDPLQLVKRAKTIIDKKKLSLEALFSQKLGTFVTTYFGPKFSCLFAYRIMSNTTFTISNMAGPAQEIAILGNPVTYVRVTSTSLPHAITMHMVSYAGRADMQILVAKDIIPDPKLLAECLENALLEMKEFVVSTNSG